MKKLSPQVGNLVMLIGMLLLYVSIFINRFVISFLSDWSLIVIFFGCLLVSAFFIEYEKRDREAGWDILYTFGMGLSMFAFLFILRTTNPWIFLVAMCIGTIGMGVTSYPVQRVRIKKLRKLEFVVTVALCYIILWYTPTWVEWIDAMVTK